MSRTNSGYIAKMNAEKAMRDSAHTYSQALTLDCTVIALGQLGMDADFLHKFMEEWNSVYHDIANDILKADYESIFTNNRKDKIGRKLDFVYSKEKIDELILQYIHPEDYEEYDYRYGLKAKPKNKNEL